MRRSKDNIASESLALQKELQEKKRLHNTEMPLPAPSGHNVKNSNPFETATFAVVLYCFCSSLMLLVNKYVVTHYPYSSLVMLMQLGFSMVTVSVAQATNTIDPIERLTVSQLRRYFNYAIAFVLGLYSSMQALRYVNVETVIVFRSCLPLAVSILEWSFLGREFPQGRSLFALLVLVVGSFGYVQSDNQFKMGGLSAYSWVITWFFLMCFTMTYGKQITNQIKLSTWGSVQYNNLMSVPAFILLGVITGEYNRFYNEKITGTVVSEDDIERHSSTSLIFLGPLFVSCVIGVGISYAGWLCRKLLSATTYTLIGVVNKFATVLLNILLWDKHASPMGLFCLVICLIASTVYKQPPLRNQTSNI